MIHDWLINAGCIGEEQRGVRNIQTRNRQGKHVFIVLLKDVHCCLVLFYQTDIFSLLMCVE